jgi:predicted dehydrogenase
MPGNFALQIESFARAILEKKSPEVTGYDGLRALEAALAAYQSYETQSVVRVKPT